MSGPTKIPDLVTRNEAFRLAGAYWVYQDQVSWSRTQILMAFEAAVLAVAFTRKADNGGWPSLILLLLGAVIVFCIYKLIQRDWQIRDHIFGQLSPYMEQNGFDLNLQQHPPMEQTEPDLNLERPLPSVPTEGKWGRVKAWLVSLENWVPQGRCVVRFIAWGLVLVNVVLAVWMIIP